MHRTLTVLAAISGAGLLASACATDSQAFRQGATGAAVGAVAGAVIGNNTGSGDARRGAAIGAAVGATAGVVRGSSQDRANQNWDAQRGLYCYREGDCYYPDGRRYR